MIEDESAFVLCRICEEQIDALQIDNHLTNCQQVFEQKKQLNTLDLEIQKLCEKAQTQHRTYQTQYQLQKSKLTRLMTPDRCSMKSSAPLRRTIVDEEEQQMSDNEYKQRDSQKSLSSKPQVKSKFSKYQSQNEVQDSPESIQNIEILKEDANEQEIDEIYEDQMKQSKKLQNPKHQTPQPLMSLSRLISSPLSLMSSSPRSSENDVLEKMNNAKFQLNQLNLIIKYTEKIMKNQNQYSIQNDLEAQVELMKLNKNKSEVQELIQLTLNLIEQRVQCIQKLIKLSKPIQNEDENQNSTNSQQRNSISLTKSKQFNIIDFINKRQIEKELNEQPKWISRPNTITQFDQLTPENHDPQSKTFSDSVGVSKQVAFDFQQCLSQSESINSISDEEQQAKKEQIFQSNDINSFKNIEELQLINDALDNDEDQKSKAYYSDGDNQPKKYNIKSKQILNVKLQDFEFIQVLGIGAFGAVWLVSKKKTNDYYAMKVIDCRNKKLSEIQDLRAEKNVFEILEGEFVVQAYYSFIQDNCLFFLLDYMKGGDFSLVLSYYGRLDENIAKFYLAELLLAIESLHKKGIIHRDLKPQNILLDSNGHLKLADFGLSEIALVKKVKDKQDGIVDMSIDPGRLPSNLSKRHIRTKTIIEFQLKQQTIKQASIIEQKHSSGKRQHRIIGTPDYIPPEVILGKSISNFSIDLWSYGVIMYEFLVGIPPFNDQTVPQVFENIIQNKIEWPDVGDEEDQITANAYNLIKSLLDHDFKRRIDIINIKQHPFFQGIDWQNIRQEEAPIIPIRDLEAIEPEEVDQNKKLNEEAKMKKMLNTVERSHDGSTLDEVNTQLKQIANLTRIDLLAKLSKMDANNVIQRRGSTKLGIINNKQFL